MRNIKKYLFILVSGLCIMCPFAFAQNYVTIDDANFNSSNTTVNMYSGGVSSVSAIGINTIGTTENKNGSLIDVIKSAINRVLGMLSLIALVLCLWGGFQIVTAAGDEGKQKKGMSVLKHAAIGLVVIGLSWFIVTIVFWILRGITGGGGSGGGGGGGDGGGGGGGDGGGGGGSI